MARSLPLRRCESLEELEDDINTVLEGIDWGWVRIAESGLTGKRLTTDEQKWTLRKRVRIRVYLRARVRRSLGEGRFVAKIPTSALRLR